MKYFWCFLLFSLAALSLSAQVTAQPFRWQSEVKKLDNDKYQVTVNGTIAKNAYLYAENTNVQIFFADGSNRYLTRSTAVFNKEGAGIYPAGTHRWQGVFDKQPIKVVVNFQGCTTGGEAGDLCMMPETLTVYELKKSAGSASDKTAEKSAGLPEKLARALEKFPVQKTVSGLLTQQELIAFLQEDTAANKSVQASENSVDGFWAILLLVVLGGLSLNLTPCVLPMIPINLAIIGAAGSGASRWQGFRRGLAYALGITLAYGALGLLAALTGSSFGALNSSSIFNWAIAVIFILLSLGMLGVYEIDFTRFSTLFKGKSKVKLPPEISAFLLGIMAALLAGACVAPVVITVVVLAGKLYSEGALWALALPFALGLSMALPWPLLGAGMSVLPKPGAWMVRVKQIFGVLILLMALYYAYLGWTIYRSSSKQPQEIEKLAMALEQADENGQAVLIDCWATWCKNCAALEKVLQTPEVKKAAEAENIHIVKFQAEDLNDPAVKAFMQKYSLPGLPSLVLLKKE